MFVLIPAAEQKERLAAQGAVSARGAEGGSVGVGALRLSFPHPFLHLAFREGYFCHSLDI